MSLSTATQETLRYQHLLAYNQCVTVHFEQWRYLRIQQQAEVAKIGLFQMTAADWQRLRDQISTLRIQQQQELTTLLSQQAAELAEIPTYG